MGDERLGLLDDPREITDAELFCVEQRRRQCESSGVGKTTCELRRSSSPARRQDAFGAAAPRLEGRGRAARTILGHSNILTAVGMNLRIEPPESVAWVAGLRQRYCGSMPIPCVSLAPIVELRSRSEREGRRHELLCLCKRDVAAPAVATCRNCGAGLCMEHLRQAAADHPAGGTTLLLTRHLGAASNGQEPPSAERTPVTSVTERSVPVDPTVDLALLAKALGHPVRVEIIELLVERERCYCGDLVDLLPLAQATVSQHLKVLRNAGLIQGETAGPRVCYCVDAGRLAFFADLLVDLAGKAHSTDRDCCAAN